MTLTGKRILLLLGGQWHDFDGYAGAVRSLLEPRGAQVEAIYDLDRLLHLQENAYDLVISYTCLTHDEDGTGTAGPDRFTTPQIEGLAGWVRQGGAFLAAHAATVVGESDPALVELIGGAFVSHPPQFAFTVYPVFEEHPITAGIEAFTVHDEFYVETHTPDVRVHMVALDRGVAYPMVWSRRDGQGRVAHIAPGHSRAVWDLEPFQKLLVQTVEWLIEKG